MHGLYKPEDCRVFCIKCACVAVVSIDLGALMSWSQSPAADLISTVFCKWLTLAAVCSAQFREMLKAKLCFFLVHQLLNPSKMGS